MCGVVSITEKSNFTLREEIGGMGWIFVCYFMNNILIFFYFLLSCIFCCCALLYHSKKNINSPLSPQHLSLLVEKKQHTNPQAVQTSNIPHPYITIYMYISMWHETLYYCHHVPNRQTFFFYVFLCIYIFLFFSFHYIPAMKMENNKRHTLANLLI